MTIPSRRCGEAFDVGPFSVTVNFHPTTGTPCEVFFRARGKIGHDLNDILYEIGVRISKVMQGERFDGSEVPLLDYAGDEWLIRAGSDVANAGNR